MPGDSRRHQGSQTKETIFGREDDRDPARGDKEPVPQVSTCQVPVPAEKKTGNRLARRFRFPSDTAATPRESPRLVSPKTLCRSGREKALPIKKNTAQVLLSKPRPIAIIKNRCTIPFFVSNIFRLATEAAFVMPWPPRAISARNLFLCVSCFPPRILPPGGGSLASSDCARFNHVESFCPFPLCS